MAANREVGPADTRRIVITGVGIVSPLGSGVENFWSGLTRCKPVDGSASATSAGGHWTAGRRADFEGRVDEFGDLAPGVRRQLAKSLKLMNRETVLGVAAGLQALLGSGILGSCNPERLGVAFGAENVCLAPDDFRDGVRACADDAGEVDVARWGSRGLNEVAPLWLLRCLPNMPACHLAILADLRGPSNTMTRHELGTDLAIAEACRIIRSGEADAMVVGGVGTKLPALHRLHSYWEGEVSDTLQETPTRGMANSVPAEGAGALVLEEASFAMRRGAPLLGEVLAAASTSSGSSRREAIVGSTAARAARLALHSGRLEPDRIGHIHTADLAELPLRDAAADVLLDSIGCAAHRIPVVSVRSHLGDAGAGSSAMELVASLLSLSRGPLPACYPRESIREPGARQSNGCYQAARPDSFLKLTRDGTGQASCLAISRSCDAATEQRSAECSAAR